MLTAKEAAAKIRQELKAAGYTSKQVSVKMGAGYSSINVRVKAFPINMDEIKAIASQQEHVRRDHYSGEILCGGNLFVFVEVDWETKKAAAAEWEPRLQAILDTLEEDRGVLTEDGKWWVMKEAYGRVRMRRNEEDATYQRYVDAFSAAVDMALVG